MNKSNLEHTISIIWLLLTVVGVAYFANSFLFSTAGSSPSLSSVLISASLFSALVFLYLHCLTYFRLFVKSVLFYDLPVKTRHPSNTQETDMLADQSKPSVSVIVPVKDEPRSLLLRIMTAIAQVNYASFEVILVDSSANTDNKMAAIDLAQQFGIKIISRPHIHGYKASALNDAINSLSVDTKYILLLDIEHAPCPEILSELVPCLESDQSLAFVQSPQYYGKEPSKLHAAYALQQHIFFKHVCRGLSVENALFMSGSNVLIRLSALQEVGGFDESTVTEDLTTSYNLHLYGYRSKYLDKVLSHGLPPACQWAYKMQQLKWAYGTLTNWFAIMRVFLRHPSHLSPLQWWLYLFSNGTWYLLGWVQIIFLIIPIISVLKGIPILIDIIGNISTVLLVTNALILLLAAFERRIKITDVFFAQSLYFSNYVIFALAFILLLSKRSINFAPTLKEGQLSVPLQYIAIHSMVLLGLILAVVHVVQSQRAIVILLWCGFFALQELVYLWGFLLPELVREWRNRRAPCG